MTILFVCRGNVGRSQMAEAIFRSLAGNKYIVRSAGIGAWGSDGTDMNGMLLKDRPSSKLVLESLREMGIDASTHIIKRLTPEMVAEADKIFVMVEPETVPDFVKASGRATYWIMSDPDEQPLEFNRQVRDDIKEKVEDFLKNGSSY